MDRSRFDIRADQFRAHARELQATAEDCVARAMSLLSGENASGLAGASPDESGASLALGQVCRRIEDVMAAYDRLQEALGGEPRYARFLEPLAARPKPGSSSPAQSD